MQNWDKNNYRFFLFSQKPDTGKMPKIAHNFDKTRLQKSYSSALPVSPIHFCCKTLTQQVFNFLPPPDFSKTHQFSSSVTKVPLRTTTLENSAANFPFPILKQPSLLKAPFFHSVVQIFFITAETVQQDFNSLHSGFWLRSSHFLI